MKFLKGFTEVGSIQVGIYFRGCDAFMPQHFLHSPKVGTPFHQVCRKRMAEGVWRNGFLYARFANKVLQQNENHLPG